MRKIAYVFSYLFQLGCQLAGIGLAQLYFRGQQFVAYIVVEFFRDIIIAVLQSFQILVGHLFIQVSNQ